MNKFLKSNAWQWRLARTIVQGILGVIVANVDTIAGAAIFDPSQRALVVALVMAVLSPVMAVIGEADKSVEGEHVAEDSEE
jgi:hypothetical protein